MSKFKDISLATIVRTLCLAFALFNQVLSACGHPMIPLDNAQMEQFLTSVITVIAALVSWWKNSSFTKEAIEADKVYDKLVASRKRGDSYFCRDTTEQCIDILQCASRVVRSAVTNTAHEGS